MASVPNLEPEGSTTDLETANFPLPSEHYTRYKNFGQQQMIKYINMIQTRFVEGKTIERDGHTFLLDFFETMTLVLREYKIEIKLLKDQMNILKNRSNNLDITTDRNSILDLPIGTDATSFVHSSLSEASFNNVDRINLNSLVKKPPYFNGITPLPREWIEEYLDAIEDNQWNHKTAIFYFKHFLKGEAALWFKFTVRPLLSTISTFDEIYKLFEQNYLGRAEKERITSLLNGLKMRHSDRVANFIPKIRQYLHILNPTMSQEEVVRHIERKLRPEYAAAVIDQEATTVEELSAACRKAEARLDLEKSAKEIFGSNIKNNFEDKKKKVVNKNLFCKRCLRNNHIESDCKARYNLKKEFIDDGKFKKEEKNNYPKSKDKSEQPKSTNVIGSKLKSNVENLEGHNEVETTFHSPLTINTLVASCLGKRLTNNLIFTDISCNNLPIRALIDTGAAVSVIDANLSNKYGKLEPTNYCLSGANQEALDVKGQMKARISISLGNITKSKYCNLAVVANLSSNFIIGTDLLKAFGINIDYAKSEVYFDKTIKIGVCSIIDQVIPKRSQCIIPCSVPVENLMMIKPFNSHESLDVAHTIVKPVNSMVPILILNSGNNSIHIKSGTRLASFSTLDNTGDRAASIANIIKIPETDIKINIGDQLDNQQIEELIHILKENVSAFSLHGEIGCCKTIKHVIELLPNTKPIVEPNRRHPKTHIEETRRQVENMLKENIIEESSSPWSSQYVIVKKKTGDMRLCIDFRRLNDVTKKNVFPLPNIENCLESMAGKLYFSQFDFASGYWQIEMDDNSKELTAFRTESGLYQFRRMPFGLCNAPATFQNMMNKLLQGLDHLNIQVYLDDVCLATSSWEKHLFLLNKFLSIVRKSNLKLKPSKCALGMSKIKFLGHEISSEGIRHDVDKLLAISNLPRPRDVSGVRRLLGSLNYYRKFTPEFAKLSSPLVHLTKKNAKFEWTQVQDEAFKMIIKKLTDQPILIHFDHKRSTRVKTDASISGIAGILEQLSDGIWKLVACCSRRLSPAETKYGITELEGLAVVYTLTKFRPYLLGITFTLLVDHCALCILKNKTPTNARLHRWAILLSEFNFSVQYVKGTLHSDVDCLSRSPITSDDYCLDDKILAINIDSTREDWSYEDDESASLLNKAIELKDDLKIIDNYIYKSDKIYIPPKLRTEILNESHKSAISGHGGIQVTLARLKNIWWPSIRNDTIQFVSSCEECQLRKSPRSLPSGSMLHFNSYEPFKKLSMDTLGPLEETVRGFKYVLVIIDLFTKYIELKALRDVQAPDTVEFLTEIISRYGPPEVIFCDNGPQFNNDSITELLNLFGIQTKFVTPDHSQGNAPAERAIQTVQEKLSLNCLSRKEMDHWDIVLPTVMLSLNTSIHSSTGFQPYELMFGRTFEYFNIGKPNNNATTLHLELIRQRLNKWRPIAISNQSDAQLRSRPFFEERHRIQEFNVGDKVSMRCPNKRRGKLDPRYLGPFEILSKNNDIYKIKEVASNKVFERHTDSLKPFNTRPNTLNSWIGTISLFLLIYLCLIEPIASLQLQPSNPILWELDKSKIIFGHKTRYDVILMFTDPCQDFSGTRDILRKHDAWVICYNAFHKEWSNNINELIELSINSKRQLLVGATLFLGYTIYTNFFNWYRERNVRDDLTNELEQIRNEHRENYKDYNDIIHKITSSIEDISQDIINIKDSFYAHSFFTITAASHISKYTRYIENIVDTWNRMNYLDVQSLSRLLNLTELHSGFSPASYIVEIKKIDELSLQLIFDVVFSSPDSGVYNVKSLNYWVELDTEPKLITYKGPSIILYNQTNNCKRTILDTTSVVIFEICSSSLDDPHLQKWDVINLASKWENIKQETQVLNHKAFNIIYCFPGNVSIKNENLTCPIYPFRLAALEQFSTSDLTYESRSVEINVTLQTYIHEEIIQLNAIHPDFTNRTLQIFTKLRTMKEEKSTIAFAVHHGFEKFLFVILSIAIIIPYVVLFVYWSLLKFRKVETSQTVVSEQSSDNNQRETSFCWNLTS